MALVPTFRKKMNKKLTVKLASGLAVFIAGLVIDWVHLDTTVVAQTEATLNGLRLWMTIPSIILLVVGILFYQKFYKLDEKKMTQITEELSHRS